jgi:threonine/homoserine/homoserine lactone efflux protein
MNDLGVLLRGIGAGLVISAPVGPVNVLCISRTLAKGRKAGLISGLGAAVADTIYGAIAGFSIHYVIGFLIREEFWIRLFGGTLLIVIGVRYYRRKPLRMKEIAQDQSARSDFATAFLLNLTNPTTVLSFMAVLTAFGLRQHKSPAGARMIHQAQALNIFFSVNSKVYNCRSVRQNQPSFPPNDLCRRSWRRKACWSSFESSSPAILCRMVPAIYGIRRFSGSTSSETA